MIWKSFSENFRNVSNQKKFENFKHLQTFYTQKSNILHLVAVIATTNFLWPVGGKNNFRTNKTTSKFREKKIKKKTTQVESWTTWNCNNNER